MEYGSQEPESIGVDLDKDRFEGQNLNGEPGYFDKLERVFISRKALEQLILAVRPPLSHALEVDIEQTLEKSRSRVAQNLKTISSLGKDSYSQVFLTYLSHSFLIRDKSKRELMAILYIDLVGSTAMSAIISPEQLTTIVRIFCQEMSILISRHRGYVLKYAGDAVIGYFPVDPDIETACENAIMCAFAMSHTIEGSINVVLAENSYPKMRTRITIDAGQNQIILLGSEPDLLGHVVSRAAKIMVRARPNQIAIGANVYSHIKKNMKEKFQEVEKYRLAETGEAYSIYASVEQTDLG